MGVRSSLSEIQQSTRLSGSGSVVRVDEELTWTRANSVASCHCSHRCWRNIGVLVDIIKTLHAGSQTELDGTWVRRDSTLLCECCVVYSGSDQ